MQPKTHYPHLAISMHYRSPDSAIMALLHRLCAVYKIYYTVPVHWYSDSLLEHHIMLKYCDLNLNLALTFLIRT
jgi:hypothetical protein